MIDQNIEIGSKEGVDSGLTILVVIDYKFVVLSVILLSIEGIIFVDNHSGRHFL